LGGRNPPHFYRGNTMKNEVHDKYVFKQDPVTQRTVTFEAKDGLLIVKETVNPELIKKHLEMNKQEYNSVSHKGYKNALRQKNMWRAASIPNIIVEKWKKEENIDIFRDEDWPKIRAKLNSEEFKFLRTSPGKI
jgi:hypothetical protein